MSFCREFTLIVLPVDSLNICRRDLTGLTQLSIVEHSLCPIEPRAALKPRSMHCVGYDYTDAADGRSGYRPATDRHESC